MTMPKGWENKVQNPPATSSTSSESIIWSDEVTTGIFRKKVVETRIITNLNVSTNRGRVPLSQIDDIVVMNSKRMSQSQYSGFSAGRYTRYGMGNVKSNSRTVGDVVFMSGGRPVIIIEQVPDPHGVARLAKAARKQLISQIKESERASLLEQKTSSVVQAASPQQQQFTSLTPLNVDTPLHNPPEINWRLDRSMVSPALIKSFEYSIQIIYWIDGKKNEFYDKMIVHPIETGNYIEFINDTDKSSKFRIEIGKLTDVSDMEDRDLLGVKQVGDIKIRLTYSYILDNMANIINPTEHTQSISINVVDGKKDNLVEMFSTLRNVETRTFYWIRQDELDVYPFLPFYGLNEQIGYYNILALTNNGTTEIKKIQVMTNWRVLEYDYESHEGRDIMYKEFDSLEINPNPEQGNIIYASDLGPITGPINPSNFKPLQSPRDVIFLKEGMEVFRFSQIEEIEKITKIINDFDEQRNIKTKIRDTTGNTRSEDQEQTRKSTKITIKCMQCGKGIASDSKFCNYCGARMTPICSKCNKENPMGSQYCSNCGFVLN